MSYISYNFIALVAAGLILYALLPKALRKYVLLLMSAVYIFMAQGALSIGFLIAGTAVSFGGALFISQSEKAHIRSAVFILVIAFHLAVLFYFKYNNFIGYTELAVSELTGGSFEFEPVERVAPLGISFYTMMLIAYTADVYMRKYKAESSFTKFSLFAGYFGHIVQGPIDSYDETAESITSGHDIRFENIVNGSLRIAYGLFKKLVISERLAVIVNTVFGDYASFSWSYLALAAVSFSLQLYTDFSGCIDIVTGVSRLFGIRLSENFRQPFFSQSIAEFWRRWHITLGAFFRKYIYIPLGGNRNGKVRKYLNTIAVFALSGLWHGGKWTFVIGTGLLHCAYMITGELLRPVTELFYKTTGINRDSSLMKVIRMVRTFILVTVGFVFFRADSLTMAGGILSGIFTASSGMVEEGYPMAEGFLNAVGMGAFDALILVISLIILFLVSVRAERGALCENRESRLEISLSSKESIAFVLFLAVILFGFYGRGYDASAFIYASF